MPRLSNNERNQAIRMLNAGMSATVVPRHFGCTRKTIERLRRRFLVTGNVADRPRSGRRRVTGLFPVRPIPFRPFPFRPNLSRFAYSLFALSNFALFPVRPISVLPFCRFAQFYFCPIFISPRCHLAQHSHFAQ